MILKILFLLTFLMAESFEINGLNDAEQEARCADREVSLDIMQLECLKSLGVTRNLQKDFRKQILQKKKCPKCKPSVIDGNLYRSLYNLTFMVVAMPPNRMEGYDVELIFKERPGKEFLAWMDYIEEQYVYKLSLMGELDPNKKTRRILKKLRGKEFDQFWIKSEVK